eukprot:5251926-Amphidinium_carterae.1
MMRIMLLAIPAMDHGCVHCLQMFIYFGISCAFGMSTTADGAFCQCVLPRTGQICRHPLDPFGAHVMQCRLATTLKRHNCIRDSRLLLLRRR